MSTVKTAYHPNGQYIVTFREDQHTYIDNSDKSYTSGTGFVGRFFPKFDAKAISNKCSLGHNPKYAGRSPEDIRAEWLAEAKRRSSEGNNTHMYAEYLISGWSQEDLPAPISDRCTSMFAQVDRAVAGLLKRFVFVAAEMIIFSPGLGLSGMVDLIMFDSATNEILILDWKTNKNPLTTENIFQSGFPPIDHLQDTNKNHYILQLSLYRMILEREGYFPGVTGYRQALIHITPDSFKTIPLEYYEYEVQLMIEEIQHVKHIK